MKKITVKQKIYQSLMENTNGFMSIEDIAQNIYGDAYMRETKKHLNGLVKRNITHAIAMLAEEGHLVITLKEPTKNGIKLTRKKVLGYKIADIEDSDYVLDELTSRKERLQIASEKKITFQNTVIESGIIENKRLLE